MISSISEIRFDKKYRAVPSADMVMLQKSRTLGKSFIYVINISGPRIEPCATPTDTASLSDWALPQQIR